MYHISMSCAANVLRLLAFNQSNGMHGPRRERGVEHMSATQCIDPSASIKINPSTLPKSSCTSIHQSCDRACTTVESSVSNRTNGYIGHIPGVHTYACSPAHGGIQPQPPLVVPSPVASVAVALKAEEALLESVRHGTAHLEATPASARSAVRENRRAGEGRAMEHMALHDAEELKEVEVAP